MTAKISIVRCQHTSIYRGLQDLLRYVYVVLQRTAGFTPILILVELRISKIAVPAPVRPPLKTSDMTESQKRFIFCLTIRVVEQHQTTSDANNIIRRSTNNGDDTTLIRITLYKKRNNIIR